MKYYYIKALEKVLHMAKGRKLILYKKDTLSEIIYKNLLHMGKDVAYFVSDTLNEGVFYNKEVRSVYDLLYEEKKIYILAFALSGHADIYKALIEMGYELEKDFYISNMAGYSGKFDAIDSMLGFNRLYDDDIWGFKVYGNIQSADIRIMTLGGSTSDPTMGNYKSWPEFLYEKISQEHNIVLYSGGLGGYSVNQEFMKFVRDGLILKPDILITLDGYNDAGYIVSMKEHPYLHRYQYKFYDYIQQRNPMAPDTLDMRNPNMIVHGLMYNLTDSENWINAIRKIHAVADEFDIRYYSFFQPMILSGNAIIDDSIILLREELFKNDQHYKEAYNEIVDYVKSCQIELKKYPYITDLTGVFDGEEDVYFDICHATDKGNDIIAHNIYSVIRSALEGL